MFDESEEKEARAKFDKIWGTEEDSINRILALENADLRSRLEAAQAAIRRLVSYEYIKHGSGRDKHEDAIRDALGAILTK